MIITPQELQQWMDDGKSFTVVDVRPAEQRKEFPLAGLKLVIAEADSIPVTEIESASAITSFNPANGNSFLCSAGRTSTTVKDLPSSIHCCNSCGVMIIVYFSKVKY
jgi:rhodanese-related sulfurtransferase